eukprot:gene6098-7063_t
MSQLSDNKIVQFFNSKWAIGQREFCTKYTLDPQVFARFIVGQDREAADAEPVRAALTQYWESTNLSRSNIIVDDEEDSQQQQSSRPRRTRNILKDYYGPGIGEGASSGPTTDPLNLDSPSFDIKTFFETMIKRSSLSQLVSKDTEMVSEIRTLDGDMKTLVYENYTKFINATDIIKKMKSNVENMEEGMQLLSKNMEQITTCSDKINSTLSVRRERIDQLSGLHKLLQKLQYLTALPSRLNHCIEIEAYTQAVKYYNSNNGILMQYSNIPSFQNIQTECDNIIKNMKSKLYEKLDSINTPQTEVADDAELLMELLEPVETSNTPGLYLIFSNDVVSLISDLNKSFLEVYSYNIAGYKTLFINRFDGITSGVEKKKSLAQLEEYSRDLFGRYLSVAKTRLSSFKNPEEKIKGLELMFMDVSKIQDHLTDVSSISDIIISTVHDQIDYYFDNLQKTIKGKRRHQLIHEDILEGSNLTELSEKTAKAIIDEITQLFRNLKPFFSSETSFLTSHIGSIFSKIEVKLNNFFLFLSIHFEDYLEIIQKTANKEQFGARFLLTLASVCLYIESKGINQVEKMTADFMSAARQGMRSHNGVGAANQDLAKRIKDEAVKLVTCYARIQSERIEKLLRKALESTPNWLVLKEPRDVRMVIDYVLDELQGLLGEITRLLPASAGSVPTTPTMQRVTQHGRTPSSGGQGANNEAAKRNVSNAPTNMLFDKPLDIFAPVESNANSILVGIVKIALKSYIECLRTKTFGTNGYHQIQVDLCFLKLYTTDLFGADRDIDTLFQKAETTIRDRCVDPMKLEETIIAKICDTKFKSRKTQELASKTASK